MNTLGSRIKLARGSESQESFATKTALSKGSLGGYERDENSPSAEAILKICSGAEISVEWLMTGCGPMRRGDSATPCAASPAPPFSPAPHHDREVVWIPLVEAALPTGHARFEPSAQQQAFAFRRDFIARRGRPQDMVLLRVAGDSMSPEVLDNDIVLLDQSKRDIVPGKVFAVGFEEGVYLKRLDYLPGKLVLKCANPSYPPVELDVRGQSSLRMQEQMRIIGRVLWSGRDYF